MVSHAKHRGGIKIETGPCKDILTYKIVRFEFGDHFEKSFRSGWSKNVNGRGNDFILI